jgi:nitrogen fixation-related uncharacterized protein
MGGVCEFFWGVFVGLIFWNKGLFFILIFFCILMVIYRVFNRQWAVKLQQKRDQEAEAERVVKTKAAEDMANWTQQREVRLNAKKEKNRSEEQVQWMIASLILSMLFGVRGVSWYHVSFRAWSLLWACICLPCTVPQVLLEGVESEADGTNVWERVTKLVGQDTEPEAGKADVTRMRKLFIQLKNEPLEKTRAAGAVEAK